MKFLRGILTVLLLPVLSGLIMSLTITIFISSTLLSNSYVSKVYEEYDIATQLSDGFYAKINNYEMTAKDGKEQEKIPEAGQKVIDEYKKTIINTIEKEWFEEQVSVLILKTHAYITHAQNRLPVISIEPIKVAIPKILVDSIIANSQQGDNKQYINQVISMIKIKLENEELKSVSRSESINQIQQTEDFSKLGLGDEVIDALVEKVSVMEEEQLNEDDIYRFMIDLFITDKMKLDQLKDQVDIQTFTDKIFEIENNPLLLVKNIVFDIKYILIAVNLLAIVCVLMMHYLLKLRIYKTIRYLGIVCILVGSFETIINIFMRKAVEHININSSFLDSMVSGVGESLVSKNFVFIVVTFIFGILLIGLSIFLKSNKKDKIEELMNECKSKEFILHKKSIRVFGFIFLGTLACVLTLASSAQLKKDVDRIVVGMGEFSQTKEEKDIAKIIYEEIGLQYQDENVNDTHINSD